MKQNHILLAALLLALGSHHAAAAQPRQGSTLYDPAEAYNANAPVYPQVYSAEQVEEQRRAGIKLVKEFREAVAAKKTEFRAAPGVYRLPKGSDFGVGTFDAFTLHLPQCELIMESIERPLFPLWRVKSFEIVGPVVVDCDPLPYSQGRIVASDYEKRRVTVEVAPGYRALVAKADKDELFYAYSPAGIWLPNISWSKFAWNDAALSADGRSVTFSAGQDLQRDYWDRLYSPGNLTTIGPSGPDWLFVLEEVGNLTVRDLDFYGGGFCYRNATETCTLTRVRGRRRPGTNRLCGGGAWQSSTRQCRVTLDSCEFRTSQDDLLDMSSSSMDMVWQKAGPRELVVWSNIWHRYQDDEPGSRFAFYQKDFTPLTSAQLVSAQRVPDAEAKPWIEPAAEFIRTTLKFKDQTGYRAFWRLTFDQDLDLPRGTLVEDEADRQMELVMRNCLWSEAGVRVMIQSGKRLELTNNHFVRLAGGLDVVTDSWWWQGATVHNVLIADNVFIDCSYGALWGSGRAALSVHNGTPPIAAFPASYPNSDIVIRNNRIDGSSAGAIMVQNSDRVQITGNHCRNLFQMKKPEAAIDVAGSAQVLISGNTIENCPAPALRAEWVSGLQCQDNSAINLGAKGKPTVMVELRNVRQATVQDNRAEQSQLDAVVRQKNSSEVQARRNRATDAPTVPALIGAEPPAKKLPLPGEVFWVQERPAFVIAAKAAAEGKAKPWVWYAPTLPGLPSDAEKWMFEKFTDAGIAIAGIDAGESYGSPAGNALFSALYAELTEKRGFAQRPVLLGRSRGGLMTLSWAAANPEKVGGFAGIYPVCNLSSYPGLATAAPAFKLTQEELKTRLAEFNPVDRLEPLAKAGVPLFAIHGDVDRLVPLDANSGLMKSRYAALGGAMELVVPAGQGHNMWTGFFQCEELVAFVKTHCKP